MEVIRIWRQDQSELVWGCTILEVVGGPKRYARIFDGASQLEWGWTLHEMARPVQLATDAPAPLVVPEDS